MPLTNEQINTINEEFKDSSDIDFGESDLNFLKKMNQMYGNVLTAKGLNILDPIEANLFHYNKSRMTALTDYPRVTRSVIFFTRPECNFSYENINSIPFFKWLYSKPIGKAVMSMLTDPDYFLNAPSAFNSIKMDPKQYDEIYKTMHENLMSEETGASNMDKEYAQFRSEVSSDKFQFIAEETSDAEFDGSASDTRTKEEINESYNAELDSINLDELTDTAAIDQLSQPIQDLKEFYQKTKGKYGSKAIDEANKAINQALARLHNGNLKDSSISSAWLKRLSELGVVKASSWMNYDKKRPNKFNFTSPFIPLLSNCCVSLEGAKDASLEVHQYEEDKFSSNLTVPTGFDSMWGSGQLTTEFEDIAYSPCGLLFMVYLFYIHYVSRGHIMTTREHITERVLDYTISIYNFVLGSDGRHIERWAKWTGCYPTNFPFSSQIKHSNNLEHDLLHKFSITWNYNRYEPMDPQVFRDFNFLSESEWLFKLKPSLWENLYNREGNIVEGMFESGAKIENSHEGYKDATLRHYSRNPTLWDVIAEENQGMSGKLPPELVDSDNSLIITNYWGGYPYIANGNEFVWVLPEFSVYTGETARDVAKGGKIISNPITTSMTEEAEYNLGDRNASTFATWNYNAVRRQAAIDRGLS